MVSAGTARECMAQARDSQAAVQGKPFSAGGSSSSSKSLPEAVRTPNSSGENHNRLFDHFAGDQRRIWTSPAKLRFSDTEWLVPLSGITAGLFVTDRDFSKHLSQNPTTISHYKTLSNAGVAALVGGGAGMWLLGHASHNEHWSETGFLAGEAALNSLVAVESFKYSLRRQRPYQGDGSGSFFQGGGASFPSEHAAAAWSVAGVIAHEYPGPLTKIMAYGLASLVDISRVRARQHFPSDVVVGSVIGSLVAQNIYSRHHDFDLGGGEWRSISQIFRSDGTHSSANQGSPYVPLDSWVYPAFDRLIGMGYIRSAFLDMRPWTRSECARIMSEAGERIADGGAASAEAARIYDLLAREFSQDMELLGGSNNGRMRLESVYTRFTGISGKPLADGYQYDFGQTIINDFGRPYEEGFNNVTGFSGWATEGTFTAYVRGEFQYAPSAPALTASARQVISEVQNVPAPPALAIAQVNRVQLLDAYVGMTLENWQITFGRQSLWWGPASGGAMMFSDNAEPINMFRINRVSPFKLPGILGWFGPMRVEFFLGQLEGQNFIFGESTGLLGSWTVPFAPQPMINGQRLSFKPTRNVEFGFSRTTLFAGEGRPFTLHTLVQSAFSLGQGNPGTPQDPGDRRSGFDFTYRLPKLRNWATFYADGFSDDQITPVAYWDRAAWTAGIYFSHIPKVLKLDLRLEGVYTDLPIGGAVSKGFFYWNDRYQSGYTYGGYLLGSWIGREGQGAQVWSSYWFNPRNRLQFNFRHQKISNEFLPGGGSLTDAGARTDYWLRPSLGISAWLQYERWLFPVIQPNTSRNVTAAVQVLFAPQELLRHSRETLGLARTTSGTGDRP